MSAVAEHASAEDFGVNRRAAIAGVAQSLEHQHRRPFAHHEAIAIGVERSAGLRGIVVLGEHAHVVEPGGKQRVDRFGAAGQCEVALSVANRADGFQDGDRAARTGGGVAEPRAAEVELLGHHGAGGVRQPLLEPGPLAGW